MKTAILVPPSTGLLSSVKSLAETAVKGIKPRPEICATVAPILRRKGEIGKVVILMGASKGGNMIGADKAFKALRDGGFSGPVTAIDGWDWRVKGMKMVRANPHTLLEQIKACCR